MRPPRATIADTSSGTSLTSSLVNVIWSPSSSRGPNPASLAFSSAPRPATRTRTAVPLSNSSIVPDPITAALRQPDGLQGAGDLLLPGRPRQGRELAVQRENLARGQPALVSKELGQVADAPPDAEVADGLTQQPALASTRLEQAQQQL